MNRISIAPCTVCNIVHDGSTITLVDFEGNVLVGPEHVKQSVYEHYEDGYKCVEVLLTKNNEVWYSGSGAVKCAVIRKFYK